MASPVAERAIKEQFICQNIRHLSPAEAAQVARMVKVRDINVGEDCEEGACPPMALVVTSDERVAVNLDALEAERLTEIYNVVDRCLQRLNRPAA